MTQADAHFAGWLQCPVCHAETGITPRIGMITHVACNGESGAKNAKSSEYSSNKLTANGNKANTTKWQILFRYPKQIPILKKAV